MGEGERIFDVFDIRREWVQAICDLEFPPVMVHEVFDPYSKSSIAAFPPAVKKVMELSHRMGVNLEGIQYKVENLFKEIE